MKPALLIGLLALLVAAGASGYAFGKSKAPDQVDAVQVSASATRTASASAHRAAAARGRRRGYRAGAARGKQAGRSTGRFRGVRTAQRKRDQQLAAAQQAEQQRQQEAAGAEKAERAENCGAPLFVDGYCPTDEEIERESDAESLCGPGTEEGRKEAAEKGIGCFPPGDPRNP